ncbi:glutaredoxin family protein [Streptomyces sp. NPDC014870]|uniref:glutaredoxin family protein n=1 Tax=Streptomyces sp. NPDC014870 TaxID=3364925 RepID=UPI003701377E
MDGMFGRAKKNTSAADAAARTVTLIGKPGCHLCDDARAVIEAVCAETGARWEEKDITQDEELHRAYWEQIPVVLVDGEQHTFWRVDAGRLRRELGG